MPSRIVSLVVLGLAVFCFSDNIRAQSVAKSTLSGRITNATGAGISVKLKPVEENPLALYDGYSTQASADGRFQFEDVEPGRYLVVAEAAGFLPTPYGEGPGQTGTPIELKRGQHRGGIAITLAPKDVICGKVTDERGNPAPKVEVYAFQHLHHSTWLSNGTYTTTDEKGDYRLGELEPGEYFLQAGNGTWFTGSRDLTQLEAENLVSAEPVEVGRAEAIGCHEDIRMGPRLGYTGFKIRGKIAETQSLAGKGLVLSLLEVNRTGATRVVPPAEIFNPEPSFELWPVPAGRYRLILSRGRFPANGYRGQPEFIVLGSQWITGTTGVDINGITVAPDPLASLAGQVKLQEITAGGACPTKEKTSLRIRNDADGQFENVELGADGKFSFAQVPLGTYSVSLQPFLRGAVYVKSMMFDGQPADGRRIEVSSAGPHSLEVVLSGDAAHAFGHITPDEPVERYQAERTHPKASLSGKVTNVQAGAPWVKLWAVRFNSDRSYEYSTKPEPDGRFHFENVDPGIYLLVAQGPGYALSEYGASHPGLEGKAVTLNAGQRLAGLTLNAAPKLPSLCGHIRDENGNPLPNVSVVATPSRKSGIGAGLFANPGSDSVAEVDTASTMVVSLGPPRVSTDSAGNFRFFDLGRGQYFIWTEFMVLNGQEWTQRWTYYPSSPNLDGAQPVAVGFDPDAGCRHDIQVRTATKFHVRGKIPGGMAHAADEYFAVYLVETNSAGVEGITQFKNMPGPGDAFDFANVNAGHYSIRLSGPFKKPTERDGTFVWSGPVSACAFPSNLLASQELAVRDGDVNDVSMKPVPVLSVTGQIHFEDIPKEWRAFRVEAQTVTLSAVDPIPSVRGAQVLGGVCPRRARLSSDGKFTFEKITGGLYQVGVDLAGVQGDALYLKSIAVNGQPVEGRHITIKTGQPETLTMVVSNNGGEIDVQVKPTNPPAEEYRWEEACRPKMAVIPQAVLIPDTLPPDGSGIINGGYTTAGYVQIYRVPPGRYHVVAGKNFTFHWPALSTGYSVWSDRKFLHSMSAIGTPVEISAGQKIKLLVPDATAEIQDFLARYSEEVSVGDHCAVSCTYEGFWYGAESGHQ